jgi:CIC family chloride channel protein
MEVRLPKLRSFSGPLGLSQNRLILVLCLVIGVATGLGALGFKWLIETFDYLFFEVLWGAFEWAGDYKILFLPLIPALGGLLVGPVVHFVAQEAKGHGVPEVMAAVAMRDGRIRGRVATVKAIASAICIGSGGSAGREGPIVQIGSAIGSATGQLFKISGNRLRILVGCGAAGGISAVFNAPIAGVMFAVEIILGDFGIRTLTPVVLSSVAASVTARTILGNKSVFEVAPYQLVSPWEIPLYLCLGVLAGLVAIVYTKTLYFTEDRFESFKIPGYLKPALGGLALGFLALISREIMADGYSGITHALAGELDLTLVTTLIFLKIAATSLTLGSGNSGGIFAPSLFIGAMLGQAFGGVVNILFPDVTAPAGAYALVGMAAMVSGATYATITAILIIFEMTSDYRIILPLMAASVVATFVAHKLTPLSIYTLKLARKGINIRQGREVNIMSSLKVSEVMERDVEAIRPELPLKQIVEKFDETNVDTIPVTTEDGSLLGLVTFTEIRNVLMGRSLEVLADVVIAADILTPVDEGIILTPDQSLNDAMMKMGANDIRRMPVVASAHGMRLVGMLTRRKLVNAYNRALLTEDPDIQA